MLQHDLGLLIEKVSETLDSKTADREEPVLQIDDLVQQFNVTSKTIQRRRRRGLAVRRFVFPDGKRRVGFRLTVVEQFFLAHRQTLQTTINATRIEADERQTMLRHARRLAADARRPVDEIAHRVGRKVGRSALAIEAELRKHDAERPNDAVLADHPLAISAGGICRVRELHNDGLSIGRVAELVNLPRSTVFRVVLAERLDRVAKQRIKFLDDSLYHQDDAERVIAHLVAQQPIESSAVSTSLPGRLSVRDLSPELRSICSHDVLTAGQERALFLQFNFRKFQAAQARHRLDPAKLKRHDLSRVERLLRSATDVRNRLVRANLRLVVSVAKKHVRPHLPLAELVNEGSLTLMRAVESFDTCKGNKFSTYATLALMKGFARTVGRSTAGPVVFALGEVAERSGDLGAAEIERVDAADRVERLLAGLPSADRECVCRHFGVGGMEREPNRRLGKGVIEKIRSNAGVL
ncbi:MAG: sigma factor [Tepidisphaeraceae bacterium]